MRSRIAIFWAILLLVPIAVQGQTSMAQPTIVTPSQVQWQPGTGQLTGAEMATISGDLSQSEPYVVRLRLPDGGKLAPHFHGDTERVTVLQGTLMVGLGDTMDASKMTALPVGSYVEIPPGMHHYAMARGVTIVQINGTGPFTMTKV